MKKVLIISTVVAIVLIASGIYVFNKSSVPLNLEKANILDSENKQNSEQQINQDLDLTKIPEIKNFSFTFTGYGPAGKFHDGSFKDFRLSTSSIVFKAATVDTGIDGLNKHLCAPEFFDCVKYSDITFMAESINKKSETLYEVKGTLKFKDVIKQVSFNATSQDNKFLSDFLLDTTEFNFNPKLVENNVRIRFSFEI